MKKQSRLFGTNGIRGVVNKEITTEFAVKIGYAIGTFFKGGNIIVGYDGRLSSPMLAKAISSGLMSTGCNVYNVGMAPTPAIQFAVRFYNTHGGVIVTASHNPPEYNGIKVLTNDGIELSREYEIEIEGIYFEEKYKLTEWDTIGQFRIIENVTNEYIHAIQKQVDASAIQKRNFKVVLDPANGVGSLAAPYLLRELNCKVFTLNANIDGTFPSRPSEPRPENLHELAKTVKAVEADLGIAYDGDADRAIFVDEKGEIHWGDRTFALIEKYFLIKNPGETIVTPVSSSQLIQDIATEFRGKVVWTKVGSVVVSHTMKKIGAKLGGEENGGVFYGPHQPVRDGAMTTALILEIMAHTKETLSRLLDKLPKYYLKKDKIQCPNNIKEKVLDTLLVEVKELKIDNTDGVKIYFSDKSSILIRPSGTEPLIRFYAEAKTQDKANALVTTYKKKLSKIIKEIEETY
jgi:phosphomannomutase/phosphoglucomutase